MKRTMTYGVIGFIVGALIPLFWTVVSFLAFGGHEGRLTEIYWNCVYFTCPFWRTTEDGALIVISSLNAGLYGLLSIMLYGFISIVSFGMNRIIRRIH
jgi:hypothetical protein